MIDLYAALLMGLVGSGHCIGMCGGLANSITFASKSNASPRRKLFTVLGYHTGRLFSYAVAGALLGGAFSTLLLFSPYQTPLLILRLMAAGMVILMGGYLAGWGTSLLKLEKLGKHWWRWIARLQPSIQRLPMVSRGFFMGTIWGWLPCGLVYSALSWAAVSGHAVYGALTMLVFGLGTLPALFFITGLSHWLKNQVFRQFNALLLIGYGIHTAYIAINQWPW